MVVAVRFVRFVKENREVFFELFFNMGLKAKE